MPTEFITSRTIFYKSLFPRSHQIEHEQYIVQQNYLDYLLY